MSSFAFLFRVAKFGRFYHVIGMQRPFISFQPRAPPLPICGLSLLSNQPSLHFLVTISAEFKRKTSLK